MFVGFVLKKILSFFYRTANYVISIFFKYVVIIRPFLVARAPNRPIFWGHTLKVVYTRRKASYIRRFQILCQRLNIQYSFPSFYLRKIIYKNNFSKPAKRVGNGYFSNEDTFQHRVFVEVFLSFYG